MKYRIRDFVWLLLAVGLVLGWYVDRSALSVDRAALSNRLSRFEERIGVDFEIVVDDSLEAERTYFEPVEMKLANIKAAMIEFRERIASEQNPDEFQTFELFDDNASRAPYSQSGEFPGFDADTFLP